MCFYECRSLVSVEFEVGSRLTRIGARAFAHSSIPAIDLPASLTVIGRKAFRGCGALESVGFHPSEIRRIGDQAFAGTGLRSVHIPYVKRFGRGVFSSCAQLNGVGCECVLKNFARFMFAASLLVSVTCPSAIEFIGHGCFRGCVGLEEMLFAEGARLREIGKLAFAGSSLRRIGIPASVETLGDSCFFACRKLVCVDVGEESRLARIEAGAFRESGIGRMVLPAGIRYIGREAFPVGGACQIESPREDLAAWGEAVRNDATLVYGAP
jgi:hypothetical protein